MDEQFAALTAVELRGKSARVPWSKGKIVGAKPPLRPSHVWSIRTKLQVEGKKQNLALFNLAIDSKLRGCDVVAVPSTASPRAATRWTERPFGRRTPAGRCTPSNQRRVRRWEHEGIRERVQKRLDDDRSKMSLRCQTAEHPFGTIKAWMGATHFKMKRLKHVAAEMALHVLAYNLKRVMAILGVPKLLRAI